VARQIRTEGDLIKINEWLLPLSWLYGLGVSIRNRCFELGILKEKSFDIPVISVGNITVGGSGKTPHVEYLVRLLRQYVQVGVLSRGYKRKSRGYVLAEDDTPMKSIGDEPFQMKRKFPDAYIAVDKNRCRGIERLTHDEKTKDVDVILLDDAFQHRYVKPGINILLVDYHRLIIYDKLLPAGRLREPLSGKNRADMVIVTKCPKDLKPMEYRVLTKVLNLFPYQQLYFTSIDYAKLRPVFASPAKGHENDNTSMSDKDRKEDLSESSMKFNAEDLRGKHVLLLTGIASPEQMENDLKSYCLSITPLRYGDHHNFNERDAARINAAFEQMAEPKIIVTTEKDAVRLLNVTGLTQQVKDNLFALPITISFMLDQKEIFNQNIISYVRKNSRNSILVKKKDDYNPQSSHHSGHGPRTISFRDN
jgi:tetraacyldisaccharide 4'-kinase